MNEMIQASLLAMSLLSDAQELCVTTSGIDAVEKINIAKYILMKHKEDMTQEVNADEIIKEYYATKL